MFYGDFICVTVILVYYEVVGSVGIVSGHLKVTKILVCVIYNDDRS